jgi:flagellar assembly protein FliH
MAAGYIPREQVQAYTRWQADDFGASPAPSETANADASTGRPADTSERVPVDQVMLPTAEDLERMHEEARRSGYQAGYDEGYQAGREAGRAEGRQVGLADAETYVTELRALCQGVNEALHTFDQELAESILACALEVARQLTRVAIHVKPEILLPTIREALAALPLHHGPVTLWVAPSEVMVAREHLEQLFAQDGWKIQEDASIAPGGCRLHAGSSEVDATVGARWRKVLEAIGVTSEWLAGDAMLGSQERS